jgi:hypothetical protein
MISKRSKIVEFFTEKSVEDSISEVETGFVAIR